MYSSSTEIEKEIVDIPSFFPARISVIKTLNNNILTLIITFEVESGLYIIQISNTN